MSGKTIVGDELEYLAAELIERYMTGFLSNQKVRAFKTARQRTKDTRIPLFFPMSVTAKAVAGAI